MAVIAALLRIYIQYLAFPLWQTGAIVQYLAVGEEAATKADTLKVFFAFALPVEALKLPNVAMLELSTHII